MYAKCEDTPEQGRILRQLKFMFSTIPHWRLREVCKAKNWHLDSCINELMNVAANASASYDMKDVKASVPSKSSTSKRADIEKSNFTKDEQRIGCMIRNGYRIMIIMRGPPGVGKSYLARSLVNNFVDLDNNYSVKDFICSSDDYFYNANGVYRYNVSLLSEAHEFNQNRVRSKANAGLSPIIVDNTNMQLWEMLPYVKFAVQNNYLIEILEPKTPWRNSFSALAEKNIHGVQKNRIQYIVDKYEKGTVASLTRMLKNVQYSKTLPQMRSLPPLKTASINSEAVQTDANSVCNDEIFENNQSPLRKVMATAESKAQRSKFKSGASPAKSLAQENSPTTSTQNVYNLLEKKATNVWTPFEAESSDFWGIKFSKSQEQQIMEINDSSKSNEKSLLDLLREDANNDLSNELKTSQKDESDEAKGFTSFQRHSIDCPNENIAFASLRQIYPNKRVSGLWDLFVKCNGVIDWAVDILLKEDELERIRGDEDAAYQTEDDELFECLCNDVGRETRHKIKSDDSNDNNVTSEETFRSILNPSDSKPQRQRTRYTRSNQRTNPALMEAKENIENCFVFGDDLYSEHLLKIRNIRSGTNEPTAISNVNADSIGNKENQQFVNNKESNDYVENEDDDDDIEEDDENEDFTEDILEMSLGEQLIQQLLDTFRNESTIEERISSSLPANLKVFMPRSLAKQLYMLWMESAFNHMEEERQKLIREDEDFARLLKNPKYSEFKQSPNNLREILDMEYAWNIYNQDKEEQQQRDNDIEKLYTANDLASHLTQMKLCDAFPDIPRETLLDMLVANGNDYNATVAVLRSTMQVENASTPQDLLIECARKEQALVNQQAQNQMEQRQEKMSNVWDENEQKSALSADEAKRLALREFEENRNLAAHHCQLKAECYQKAKEAIKSGNGGAAIYYSQIANLHIKKIDIYNHRAANCIIEVHKNTQNNPDLLDLHYLYLIEALGCLDLFLDRHITGLRVASRNYKHVFIITGRGKHSAGGVSTIKNKVKARLKERCLRWSEVNPGLLKVKIFSGSRHSKNI